MPDTPALLAFIAAGLLLNLTPGPDVFYIVNHALRSGVRAPLQVVALVAGTSDRLGSSTREPRTARSAGLKRRGAR